MKYTLKYVHAKSGDAIHESTPMNRLEMATRRAQLSGWGIAKPGTIEVVEHDNAKEVTQ